MKTYASLKQWAKDCWKTDVQKTDKISRMLETCVATRHLLLWPIEPVQRLERIEYPADDESHWTMEYSKSHGELWHWIL